MRRRKRHARDACAVRIYRVTCGRTIGMCGYTSAPFTDRHIFVNFAPPEAQNRTNWPARGPRPLHVNITVEMRRVADVNVTLEMRRS